MLLDRLEERLDSFVEYFRINTFSNPDIETTHSFQGKMDPPLEMYFVPMEIAASIEDDEERIFFLLMSTHLWSAWLGDEFTQLYSWEEFNAATPDGVRIMCEEFFMETGVFTGKKRLIGQHRKFMRCMPNDGKAEYTTKLILSYKEMAHEFGSQAEMFQLYDEDASFEELYLMLKPVFGFHVRMLRYDFLELVTRAHDDYMVIPDRMYCEESTGPLYGLMFILLGQRIGKKGSQLSKKDVVEVVPGIWNEYMEGSEYTIPEGASFKEVIVVFEQYLIDCIRYEDSLPRYMRQDPGFVFDIETTVCCWQKDKTVVGTFLK